MKTLGKPSRLSIFTNIHLISSHTTYQFVSDRVRLNNLHNPNLHFPHLHPLPSRLLLRRRDGHLPIVSITHGNQIPIVPHSQFEPTLQAQFLSDPIHKFQELHFRCEHDVPRIVAVVDFDTHVLKFGWPSRMGRTASTARSGPWWG